ncbi:unnamed protein product [Porites lobata]|uniref:Bro-N domain-containing protein n=1 Tax=Porites lobata TaxID=104759 RepID=A0ABN8RZS4_9CNID|nr:unnamed protein product [Porites lobata]
MMSMIEKKFANKDLEIELTSYIDNQQNVWFRGKDVAEILGYSKTRDALLKHVDNEDKQQIFTPHASVHKTWTVGPSGSLCTYINESGFYSLVLSSKLETAKKFKHWVTSQVLPSIRKYGQYKLFDSPWNKMIMIGNETDLHYKVVDLIRRYYPDSILVAGLGENQDTENKRLDSYKKGYMRGQPDLMVLDYHKDYKGLCIEFKSPTNNYHVSEAQLEMKKKYVNNSYAFILSNDYDKISKNIHEYMKGIRVPCKYCIKRFLNTDTLKMLYEIIHRIEK